MNKKNLLLTTAVTLALTQISSAAVVFSANGSGANNTVSFPGTFTSFSAVDLADSSQSTFLSITETGIGAVGAALLNNGAVGADAANNGEAPTTLDNVLDSLTFNFDITTNTDGYDITGINTFAGWNPGANGRSNQGFDITVTFVDDTTSVVSTGTYFSNSPTAFAWTEVLFTEDVTGVIASGVKSVTFDNFDTAGAGGFVGYREIDILGAATIPEPGTYALLAGFAGLSFAMLRRRR